MRIQTTGVYWSAAAGHGRNQDSLSLQHICLRKGECLLAAVCDGIGSLTASQEASGFVVHCLTDWFYHEGKNLILQNSSRELFLLALQRRFCHIQETLRQFQITQNSETGTTLSALLLIGNRYYLIHIGDSRIYRIRKRKIPIYRQKYHICRLTEDDKDQEGRLLKCVGVSGEDRATIETGRLLPQTCFLLCTDGFYRGNGKERIGQVLGPLLEMPKGEKRIRTAQAATTEHNIFDRRLELLGEQAMAAASKDHMAAVGIIVGAR